MDKKLFNQPCYDKEGNMLGWFSRSIAAACFVYCKDKNGEWRVLASERGPEAADHQGEWNCVCGYLDFDETIEQCAAREISEECGLNVESYPMELVGINSSPSENRQNVTIRFRIIIADKTTDDFVFSKERNEGKEVGDIKWLSIDEIDQRKWAFGHEVLSKRFFPTKD